jgi:hypothetical protein
MKLFCKPGALSLGVSGPGHEADHPSPTSAEVKNVWSYNSTAPIRLHGVMLSLSTGIILPLPFTIYSAVRMSDIYFVPVEKSSSFK